MVDVSDKAVTKRTALARSIVVLGDAIMQHLSGGDIQTRKGPVFQTAIIAGTNDLFFVKEGDTVAARFRVVRVDEDAVSLEDVNDGSSLRLSMK